MTSEQSPSIFDSFNARNLAPSQVARTFVPQEQYAKLAKRCHSMLIGPRGSGKTTLLKMLQPQALESWAHPDADAYRQKVDFSGVFIASDVSWGRQREALGGHKLDEESREVFGRALFTTHVLKSLVSCMLFRTSPTLSSSPTFRRVAMAPATEAALASSIARSWKLRPEIPSLLAVRLALLTRLSEIRELAARESHLSADGRGARLASYDFLHIHFLDGTLIGTNAFNAFGNQPDGKWGLLFDELELAPKWVVDQLVLSVRSMDDSLLFKLAMSPVSSYEYPDALRQVAGPASGQDFESIPLWYVEKHEPLNFCFALWARMLEEKALPPLTPQEVLGESYSEIARDERREHASAYHKDSRIAKSFQRLASKDKTFASYLRERQIDPKHLDQLGPEKGDEIVRKIAPLVLFRDYFRGSDRSGKSPTKRSRKVFDIYGGVESIFAVTEGNPRLFIGMVGSLLESISADQPRISPQMQARAVEDTASRFMAMLRTIPTPIPTIRGKSINIDGIIEQIGNYFEFRAIVHPFAAEPPATFRIPVVGIDRNFRASLDKAVNAGALIYVPDDGSELFLRSINGKRFRLSYLLAPIFHLPLRLGTEISLSTILSSEPQSSMPADLLDGQV